MNERQQAILAFIQRFIQENRYAPKNREIKKGTGMKSTSMVDKELDRLVEAGVIGRDKRVARGLWLIDPLQRAKEHLEEIASAWDDVRPHVAMIRESPVAELDRLVAQAKGLIDELE